MNQKKKPTPDDPAQSQRFVETAKEIEAEVTGNAFARAFKTIVPKKKRRRSGIRSDEKDDA